MNKFLTLLLAAAIAPAAVAQFPKTLKDVTKTVTGGSGSLSNEEVISGLKEALNKGTESAVSLASITDGFWKNERIRIPFPPEAEKMKTTLNNVGMSKQVSDFEMTMNRAAEEAVKEAVPVFTAAIKDMSIGDGFAILKGNDNAATQYLDDKTTAVLTEKFRPIVERATEKVALASYWTPLANAYNKAGFMTGAKAVDPDLNAYVTQKAIDGLFLLIAEEEAKIRKDPLARTTEILKKVFGN